MNTFEKLGALVGAAATGWFARGFLAIHKDPMEPPVPAPSVTTYTKQIPPAREGPLRKFLIAVPGDGVPFAALYKAVSHGHEAAALHVYRYLSIGNVAYLASGKDASTDGPWYRVSVPKVTVTLHGKDVTFNQLLVKEFR